MPESKWKKKAGRWSKTRGEAGAVAEMYHTVRGAKRNGQAPAPGLKAAPAARAALKDLAAGGGASPKTQSVRLSKEQEKDYQAIVGDGVDITRAEYYAKWKSRADQARANKKPVPATYRG